MISKKSNKEKLTEIVSPKEIKYQCLHSSEAKECTCIRSKGLVLNK